MIYKYKIGKLYALKRSEKEDHKSGRPAIFIRYFGKEALVWFGTTKKEKGLQENPHIIEINGNKTYFYSKGIIKTDLKNIIYPWRNENNCIFMVSKSDLKQLAVKFIDILELENPYEKVKGQAQLIDVQTALIEQLLNENTKLKEELNAKKVKNDKGIALEE